jgi:acyl-CoA reductase-like NAD-dependent aldehyde dehydrogenase
VATRVARADESVVREAIGAAVAAQPAMAALPAYERKAILMHVRRCLQNTATSRALAADQGPR